MTFDNSVTEEFGWTAFGIGGSDFYIHPVVFREVARLGVKRILDIGSGVGGLAKVLTDRGYDMVGVEYDSAGVELSRKALPNIKFYHFGVEDDPLLLLREEGKAFDCVLSTEVIEHLYAPNLLLSYASAVLRDDGIIILTTPYHGYLKNLLISLVNGWDPHLCPYWLGGHIKFWSRKTLTEFLAANGFEVIRFRGCGRLPWLWKSMMISARKVPGTVAQKTS